MQTFLRVCNRCGAISELNCHISGVKIISMRFLAAIALIAVQVVLVDGGETDTDNGTAIGLDKQSESGTNTAGRIYTTFCLIIFKLVLWKCQKCLYSWRGFCRHLSSKESLYLFLYSQIFKSRWIFLRKKWNTFWAYKFERKTWWIRIRYESWSCNLIPWCLFILSNL